MLQLSENAAHALETMRRANGIPESHSTRLAPDRQPTGDLAVRLEFVEETGDEDQVTEHAGTEVHVDSELATPLADSVLEVRDTPEGPAFVFLPQDPESDPT